MNDQDIIRKAVELADGWRWYGRVIDPPCPLNPIMQDAPTPQEYLDALAAQLVRQADPLCAWIEIQRKCVRLSAPGGVHKTYGPDRTMNTLRAIVESGVLD